MVDMRMTRKAQMSLIMILVVAMALILYAVSINWSRVSGYQTQVSIAATTGAATLVSMMASYGESQIQGQLGGNLTKSAATGLVPGLIVAGVLIIIAIVLACIPLGITQAAAAALGTAAVWAAGLAIASVMIDIMFIQPGLTRAWNKSIKNIPTIEGQFVEQGLQGMLAGTVNDTVMVPDYYDMDTDGRWYSSSNAPGSGSKVQKVSRYAFYYSDRLNFKPRPLLGPLQQVLRHMQINLGLPQSDGLTSNCYYDVGKKLPQWDECCQPSAVRPATCSRTKEFLEQCTAEGQNTRCTKSNLNACYIYDPLCTVKGKPKPNKLMAMLGEDDTDPHTKVLKVQVEDPVTHEMVEKDTYVDEEDSIVQTKIGTGDRFFMNGGVYRGEDATGLFFPFLHLLADTAPYVKELHTQLAEDAANGISPYKTPGCHWLVQRATGLCQQVIDPVYPVTISQSRYWPTALHDPITGRLSLSSCAGYDCYVHMFKNTLDPAANSNDETSYDPRRIDGVGEIAGLTPPVKDDECSPNLDDDVWKEGSDKFSQTFVCTPQTNPIVAPIKFMDGTDFTGCLNAGDVYRENQGGANCGYGSMVKERWRNDSLDIDVKYLSDFSDQALSIVTIPESAANLITDFENMRFELISNVAKLETLTTDLGIWLEAFEAWFSGVEAKRETTGSDLWCLPETDAGLTNKEIEAIRLNEDPAKWGTLNQVIQCLDYNSGNEAAFNGCYQGCSADESSLACSELPRSLVRENGVSFDPNDADEKLNGGYTIDNFGGCNRPGCAETIDQDDYMVNGVLDQTAYQAAVTAACWIAPYSKTFDYCTKASTTGPVDPCSGQNLDGPKDSDYMIKIKASRDLARNQSVKFANRSAYLKDIKQRAIVIRDIFRQAHTYLTANLPEEAVTKAVEFWGDKMKNHPPAETIRLINIELIAATMSKPELSNELVYGWFSKPPKGSTRTRGYLHLVKAQAAVPGFEKEDAVDPAASYPLAKTFPIVLRGGLKKPEIKTWTSTIPTTRYYKLINTDGYVGARVIRYDQDHASMNFLSQLPLWKIKYGNAQTKDKLSDAAAEGLADDVYTACVVNGHYKRTKSLNNIVYQSTSLPDPELNEAFMFDLPISGQNSGGISACADAVKQLLVRGVAAERCAKYWVTCQSEGKDCTYDIKFTSCN
jgi:hypothetical protein